MKSILADRNNYDHCQGPAIPTYDAELDADLAWGILDTGMDTLARAINASREPEYVDHEAEHIRAAWRTVIKCRDNIRHELDKAGHAFKRLRHEIPDTLMEEHGRE